MLKGSKESIAIILLAAFMLASCSEKDSSDTTSYVRSSDISSASETTSTAASADDDDNNGDIVSFISSGENTVKSSDGMLEGNYEVNVSENSIRVHVTYTNTSEYYMSCNIQPKLYANDTELEETYYEDTERSKYDGISSGESCEEYYEYDLPDSDSVYLEMFVICEGYSEETDTDDGNLTVEERELADAGETFPGSTYSSDVSENDKEAFTVSLT